MEKIRVEVNGQSERLGIDAVDVRIRRADLPQQISEQVYQRMNSERAREAAEYRAKGNEESQTIKAKADRDVVVLLGNAQQTGRPDARRGRGGAQQDLRRRLRQGPRLLRLLPADERLRRRAERAEHAPGPEPRHATNEFFRFFKSPNGPPAAKPAAPEGVPSRRSR